MDHLNLHQPRLPGTWFLDTLQVKVTSKQGNMWANVYMQGKFTKVIPMTSRKDARYLLLNLLADNVGIPDTLITDGEMEFTGKNTDFVRESKCMHILLHITKQGCKNQKHAAEQEIGMLGKCCKLCMTKKNVPKWLWDFGLIYKAEIMLRMACGSDNCTGYEEVTGQTLDISKWLDFKCYDLVWWLHHPTKPNVTDLAHWLGVSHWVALICVVGLLLTLISKSSIKHVIHDDYLSKDKKKQIKDFNMKLKKQIKDFNMKLDDLLNHENFILDGDGKFDSMYLEDIDDDPVYNPSITYPGIEPISEDYRDNITVEQPNKDDLDDEAIVQIDKYLNAELIFSVSTNDERQGHVVKHL